MDIKKITMIEAKPPGYHVYSRFSLPRLGLPIMGTLLASKGYEVTIICQDIKGIDYHAAFASDMAMISTITSTAPEAYQIADRFRYKKVPVVLGGPHVTFLPEEALAHADYVVRGEGEETVVELLEALERGYGLEHVAGLSYWDGENIRHNPDRPLLCDLDVLPAPDFSLIRGHEKICTTPIQTSRGCPFNCTFCSVTPMFGRRYRFRSTDRVMEEVERAHGGDIFFYDDNFAAHRGRSKELLRTMAENGIKSSWTAQARVDVVKDRELMDLMKTTRCSMLYIGFESINPATLAAYNKQQTVSEIKESIRILHQYGIHIHGMFVVGADTDDVQVLRDTADFAKQVRIDTLQLMMLTPLPGTVTYRQIEREGRLFSKDWSLYDGHHIVYEPMQMTPFELQTETFKAMKKFYSLRRALKYLCTFRFLIALYRFYGRRLIKRWEASNWEFLDTLEAVWKKHQPRIRKRARDIRRTKTVREVFPTKEDREETHLKSMEGRGDIVREKMG